MSDKEGEAELLKGSGIGPLITRLSDEELQEAKDYIAFLNRMSEEERNAYYASLTDEQRDHNNRMILFAPRFGPEFPIQFERDSEIVLMNWQPNEQGIGGQMFYQKDTGKYGTRATAGGQKAEIIFEEDYGAPTRTETGFFSYSMAPMMKAEGLMQQLGSQVAKLAGIEGEKFETDSFEDNDNADNDWLPVQDIILNKEDGMLLDISYSSLRHQFRVAVAKIDKDAHHIVIETYNPDLDMTFQTAILAADTLCKKFNATYVPRFGMDISDQNLAYGYAEALADLLEAQSGAPAP